MKFAIVCIALVAVVLAEDVFFTDNSTYQIVWRSPQDCHVMTMTQEQIDNFQGHDYILFLKQLMRDLAADPANVSPLPAGDVTPFITHHCHGRTLLLLTQ